MPVRNATSASLRFPAVATISSTTTRISSVLPSTLRAMSSAVSSDTPLESSVAKVRVFLNVHVTAIGVEGTVKVPLRPSGLTAPRPASLQVSPEV